MFKNPSFTCTLLAGGLLVQLGIPAMGWSPLQRDCKEDFDKASTGGSPIKQAIMRQRAQRAKEAAEAAAGGVEEKPVLDQGQEPGPEGLSLPENPDQSAAAVEKTTKAIDEFDEQMAKDPPKRTEEKPKHAGHKVTETTLDPLYYYKRSKSYIQAGDLQSALNYTNKALELNPEYWEAWYQKAMIFQLSGLDAAAARRYLELAKRHPEMLEVHISLGSLYRKHQNYDLAENEYRTAIDLSPRCFAAHYNFANVLLEQSKYEEALKEYKLCLKIQPSNAQVHNNIGVIFEKRNFFDEAADEYTKATHFDPANQKFAENLVLIRAKLGQKPSGLPM